MRVFDENKIEAKGNILPFSEFRLFRDIENTVWSGKVKAELIKNAETLQGNEYPALTATDYLQFCRCGDRAFFERKYFKRRNDLLTFLAAEVAEQKGRFCDYVINLTWLILEETTWVIPAHSNKKNGLPCEYEAQVKYIDLFSASTAAVLAFVYYYGTQAMGETAPVICERIFYELNRRILVPYQKYEMISWMGFDRKKINNWNPWIVSNILTVTAICVQDLMQREIMTQRLMTILDNFINGYESDGGCDEGPGYWTAAGASLFDALEILYDMSGGKINVFNEPLIRKMGEYIMNMNIKDNYYVTFADSHASIPMEYEMVARFGRRTYSKCLASFGNSLMEKYHPDCVIRNYHTYRNFKKLIDREPVQEQKFIPAKSVFMEGICIMVQRGRDSRGGELFLAVKGGNNAESHNHNDVGNFLVYSDGNPLIIDVGVETYSRETFDLNVRYSIWTMQSAYHNVPEFNGIMQKEGIDYTAENVIYNKDDKLLSMELKNAYPKEAGLKSYIRKFAMAENRIEITDLIEMESPGSIQFTFMLSDNPEKTETEEIILNGGCRLSYSKGLEYNCEKIELKDNTLKKDWNRDALYRVRLSAEGIIKGVYKTVIR